jgi:hypothetical protein
MHIVQGNTALQKKTKKLPRGEINVVSQLRLDPRCKVLEARMHPFELGNVGRVSMLVEPGKHQAHFLYHQTHCLAKDAIGNGHIASLCCLVGVVQPSRIQLIPSQRNLFANELVWRVKRKCCKFTNVGACNQLKRSLEIGSENGIEDSPLEGGSVGEIVHKSSGLKNGDWQSCMLFANVRLNLALCFKMGNVCTREGPEGERKTKE